MATLSTSMFGNLLNAPKSPEEYTQERQAAQLNQLNIGKVQAEVAASRAAQERAQQARNLLSGGAGAAELRRAGFLDEASKVEADLNKQREADTLDQGRQYDLAVKRFGEYRKVAGARMNDPSLSKASVLGDIEGMKQMGILTPEVAAHLSSQLPDDPVQLRQVVRAAASSQLTPEQMFTVFAAKPVTSDTGGSLITRDMNPNSPTFGQQVGGGAVKKTMAPGQAAQLDLQRQQLSETVRHNKASEGIQAAKGEAKPAATASSRAQDATDVLGLLDMADPLVGVATSSGAGSVVDTVGGAFGLSSSSADAAAQLKAIEGMLVSKMPKMSGPQSDKDVLLYKQMAGRIGDATVPVSQKKAAIQTIREINKRYASAPPGQPAAQKPSLSAQDQQAADWANANPSDPRAKQIKQRLGM